MLASGSFRRKVEAEKPQSRRCVEKFKELNQSAARFSYDTVAYLPQF